MALFPIRRTLPILITVPLVASVGLIGSLAVVYGRRVVRQLAEEWMFATTNHVQEQVVSLLQEAPLINRINANAIAHAQLNLSTQQDWWVGFTSQLQAADDVMAVYFGNEQGGFIGSQIETDAIQVLRTNRDRPGSVNRYTLDAEGNLPANPTDSLTYDPRIRDWYKAAKAGQRPVWSDVYVGVTTQELLITAAQPIYDAEDELIGVLGTDMSIREVDQFLGSLTLENGGEVFILEANGALVASSLGDTLIAYDTPITDAQDDGQVNRIAAFESPETLISDTASYLLEEFGDLSLVRSNVSLQRTINEQSMLIAAQPLRDDLGLEWVTVVVMPTRSFMGVLRTPILVIGVAMAGMLAIAIALSWLIIRWLVNPILQLHAAAVDVQSQSFDSDEIQRLLAREDEIGQVATIFAEMAEIINEQSESMEEQLNYLRLQAPVPASNRSHDLADLKALQAKAKVIREAQTRSR